MDTLAHRMGANGRVLERRFETRYGLTPKAFHTRVRVRAAVLELHGSDVKVEYVAKHFGYTGLANFYAVFERHTELTPSQVRGLEAAALEALLETRLQIGVVKLFERRGSNSS
jgi:transcriptional regulator GlxA family with amidase domain